MYNDSILVLERIKLIGGKLMEQAGMIENNHLCIVAFDKLAVWGGSNIKHISNRKRPVQFVLVRELQWTHRREKRVLFKTRSNRHRGRCTPLLFSRVVSCYLGCKSEGNNKCSRSFTYERPQKGFFALWSYDAHANQNPAFTLNRITLQPLWLSLNLI